MQMIQAFRLYVWLQALLALRSLAEPKQQVLRSQTPGRLRNATLEDVDDIVTLIIAAFSPLPDWKYLYQFDKEFPEEHKRCGREQLLRGFSNESVLIQVIEPLPGSDLAVAAVAVWEQSDSHTYASLHTSFSKGHRLFRLF